MNVRFRHMVLVMAATLCIGCGGSGDEPGGSPVPQPQPNGDAPISFSGSLSEGESESHARTRTGATALSATHQTFYAWAYKNPTASTYETVMQKFKVNWRSGSAGTSTTNSRGWEYVNQQASGTVQSIKYWDFSAADYRFFGYAGSGVDVTSTSTSVSFSFSVDATTANLESMTSSTPLFSKLWYKTGSAIASDISPVQLEFLQPYVKVRFMFKQSDSEDYNLTNMCFKPTDNEKTIATEGTFTVTYPLTGATEESWSVTNVTSSLTGGFAQDYYEADDGETDPDILAAQKKWYVVLPAHGTNTDDYDGQGTYTLSVSVNGEDKTAIVPAQYMEWRPGYEYTYIFKITDGGTPALYDVLAGFAPWSESASSYTVYNW